MRLQSNGSSRLHHQVKPLLQQAFMELYKSFSCCPPSNRRLYPNDNHPRCQKRRTCSPPSICCCNFGGHHGSIDLNLSPRNFELTFNAVLKRAKNGRGQIPEFFFLVGNSTKYREFEIEKTGAITFAYNSWAGSTYLRASAQYSFVSESSLDQHKRRPHLTVFLYCEPLFLGAVNRHSIGVSESKVR